MTLPITLSHRRLIESMLGSIARIHHSRGVRLGSSAASLCSDSVGTAKACPRRRSCDAAPQPPSTATLRFAGEDAKAGRAQSLYYVAAPLRLETAQ